MKSLFTLLFVLLAINVQAQEEQSSDQIYNMAGLDKHPEFPGNFQSEVYNNFPLPEINEDVSLRVYINFTIEKDGTLSDVKCSRDPGFGMCPAAEKAVKAVTKKWSPGIKDGVPVRVSYTLPIVVNIRGAAPTKKDNYQN